MYMDCKCPVAGRWFFLCPPVPPPKKTDRHNIAEILLKVVLNTITITLVVHVL